MYPGLIPDFPQFFQDDPVEKPVENVDNSIEQMVTNDYGKYYVNLFNRHCTKALSDEGAVSEAD